jgi:hypothetical protein
MATHTMNRLNGHVAIPFTVSGVTTPPIDMPRMMKIARASGCGT